MKRGQLHISDTPSVARSSTGPFLEEGAPCVASEELRGSLTPSIGLHRHLS